MIEIEYGIKSNPDYSGNPQAKSIIEIIHQVLGNLVRIYNLQETYVDEAEPRMGIFVPTDFDVRYTYHSIKDNSPGHLVFVQDMILSIKHVAY